MGSRGRAPPRSRRRGRRTRGILAAGPVAAGGRALIRILFLILLVFALGAGFAWLADNPGSIQISIRGYEVTISLMATAIITLLLVVVLVVLWVVVRALIRAPRALRR